MFPPLTFLRMLAQPRVKEKVIPIVSWRQSTNGAEQWIKQRSMPSCTRRCAFKAIRGITSGMGTIDA